MVRPGKVDSDEKRQPKYTTVPRSNKRSAEPEGHPSYIEMGRSADDEVESRQRWERQ